MKGKDQIITFKADQALVDALDGVPNRSEFIRGAILAALDGPCPLCHGTGVLSTKQREHWQEFQDTHSVETCDECHESRIVCKA
jgi:hypothetical protein